MISAVSASSSGLPRGTFRCVELLSVPWFHTRCHRASPSEPLERGTQTLASSSLINPIVREEKGRSSRPGLDRRAPELGPLVAPCRSLPTRRLTGLLRGVS